MKALCIVGRALLVTLMMTVILGSGTPIPCKTLHNTFLHYSRQGWHSE